MYAVPLFCMDRLAVDNQIRDQQVVFAFEIVDLGTEHFMVDKGGVEKEHPFPVAFLLMKYTIGNDSVSAVA